MTFQVASNYVKFCYKTTAYSEDFQDILTKNVSIKRSTNEEIGLNAHGRGNVVGLVKKIFFDNTSDVNFQGCKFEPVSENSIRLTITLEATKNEMDASNRYRYVEVTLLEFKEKEEKPVKIQRIETAVTRTLI